MRGSSGSQIYLTGKCPVGASQIGMPVAFGLYEFQLAGPHFSPFPAEFGLAFIRQLLALRFCEDAEPPSTMAKLSNVITQGEWRVLSCPISRLISHEPSLNSLPVATCLPHRSMVLQGIIHVHFPEFNPLARKLVEATTDYYNLITGNLLILKQLDLSIPAHAAVRNDLRAARSRYDAYLIRFLMKQDYTPNVSFNKKVWY
jgi:hypothetical protein